MLFYVCYPFFLSFLTYSQSFQCSVSSPEKGGKNLVRFPNERSYGTRFCSIASFYCVKFYRYMVMISYNYPSIPNREYSRHPKIHAFHRKQYHLYHVLLEA